MTNNNSDFDDFLDMLHRALTMITKWIEKRRAKKLEEVLKEKELT